MRYLYFFTVIIIFFQNNCCVGDQLNNENKISTVNVIIIKQFAFTGNTCFSDEKLHELSEKYTNKKITINDIESLRQEISWLYVNNGYVNSGAIIPDQKIDNGIVTLQIIEGKLNEINITGNTHFQENYFISRLEKKSASPVNISNLQEALLLLQENPRIKKINADFKKGATLGQATLNVDIEEMSPYLASLYVDNNTSPSTGEYRGGVNLAHQNVLGYGDTLAFDAELTEGVNIYKGSYSVPLSTTDTLLELSFITGDNQVIETVFKDLQIESTSDTYSLYLKQPLYKRPGREFAIALSGDIRRSNTSLLNRPFSFSPGAIDGESQETVLRFSQEWLHRSQATVVAAHSTLSVGIDALDATVHETLPDGKFFTWLGQVLFAQRFPWQESQFVFKTDLQLANDNLLSMEQFALGGLNSVRGYRKDLYLRDNGLASSAEVRIPLFSDNPQFGSLQLIPFFDLAWGRNKQPRSPQEECIYSLGLGLKWELTKEILAEMYYGHGLKDIENDDNSLQDRGFYFQLSWRIF